MATAVGPAGSDVAASQLERLLRDQPYIFEFFQAVRLLGRISPQRQLVGQFSKPSQEVVRFGANPSLSFPASAIQSLAWRQEGSPVMVVNFMGLTGPKGVLPLYYTEFIAERVRARDTALRDFFNIFNHRMISLFYRAWEKYRHPVGYERDRKDRLSHHLLDLIGLGTAGLQDRQPVPDESLLFYAGLLALQPRSETALRNILSDYFGVPVEIEQFVGAWTRLDSRTQCCLGERETESEELGCGVVVGDEIWNQQSGVRIRLGPLTAVQYRDFLPNGKAHELLRALPRFFAGGELEFQAQLILKREEVPYCELGAEGEQAPQLGWFSWMKSGPGFGRDPGDTFLLLT